jgi:hypothetical protein
MDLRELLFCTVAFITIQSKWYNELQCTLPIPLGYSNVNQLATTYQYVQYVVQIIMYSTNPPL